MEQIKNILNAVVTNESIPTNEGKTKLEQKYARALKSQLVDALQTTLGSLEDDHIHILRTGDGITLAVDTEVGFISIVLNPTIKNLDYDPFDEEEFYQAEVAAKAAKAKEKADAKAKKMAADQKAREAKAAAKAARHS